MSARTVLSVSLVSLLSLMACRVEVGPPEPDNSSSSSSSSSSGSTPTPTPTPAPTPTAPPPDTAPPEVQALFGTQVTASPDKIKGVFSDNVQANGNTIDTRFRFEKDRIIGGVHCIINGKDIMAGGVLGISTIDLESKTGTFDVKEVNIFTKTKDGETCTARIDAAKWTYTVTALALELKPEGKEGFVKMQKVGD